MAAVGHATLVANTVATVTVALVDPVGNLTSFATPPRPLVEVVNVTGTAAVYFTTDGTTAPTVGGTNCYVLPAAICALKVPDETPGATSTVKLISTGTPGVSVRAVL